MSDRTESLLRIMGLCPMCGDENHSKEPFFEKNWEMCAYCTDCQHQCSSNCRREGCNCDCGDSHIELINS